MEAMKSGVMILARILKWISIFALLALSLPFIVFFETIRTGQVDLFRFSLYMLAIIVSSFLGTFMQSGLAKVGTISTAKRRIILGAGICTFLLLLGFSLRGLGALFIFTMLLTSLYSFITISWSYRLNYGEILSKKMLIIFLITNVFGLILSRLIGGNSIKATGLIIILSEIAIVSTAYAVVSNQQNIDFQLSRRNNFNESLPSGIRHFNFILVIMTIIIAIVGIALTPIIVYAMRGIMNLGKLVLRSLLSLFIDTGNSGEIGQGIQLPQGQGDTNIWQNPIIYLMEFLTVIGIIYLVLRFRKQIINKVISTIKKIFIYIADILNRHMQTGESIDNKYYYDEIIKIEKGEVAGFRQYDELKSWRRKYRRYKRSHDDEDKFRTGFRLIREYHLIQSKQASNSDSIQPSDTPYEALSKLSDLPEYNMFKVITNGYNGLHYGYHQPTNDAFYMLDKYLHLAYKNKI